MAEAEKGAHRAESIGVHHMTVFILGAGVMQIPAIRTARELGWTAVVADGNAEAVGIGEADHFLHVDLKDLPGLEAAARRIQAELGLDAVFTAGTDFSASVAYVARKLGLPGIPYEAALAASDKLKMRAAFAEAGVPSPRFMSLSAGEDPLLSVSRAGLSLPLVVKPADNMGARGCRLARTEAELVEACAAALPFSRTRRAIVEEYMDGPEFSIDSIVVEGEVTIRGFADRHIWFSPYFVELGHTMPSAYSPEIREAVIKVFKQGVAALGLGTGTAKGDMKWCPALGTAMVGEIAARLSGGYMSGWTYPYASGIEVTREALELAAGLAPSPSRPDRGWVSAERAFMSIPGKVSRLVGLRAAEASPYVKNLFSRVSPGDSCVFPSNNVEKCGNVISQAPDRATAIGAAEAAIRGILVRLEPGCPDTEAFLAGAAQGAIPAPVPGAKAWPPEAFSPPEPILAAIEAMPDRLLVAATRPGLLVLSLPEGLEMESYAERDWAGRSFMESAELALALAGAGFLSRSEALACPDGGRRVAGCCVAIGAPFWRALARGGAQAALYVLDTEARGGAGA
jgi:biotin carboxylase